MKRISIKEVCIGCGFCEVKCIVKVSDFRDCLHGYGLSVLENK